MAESPVLLLMEQIRRRFGLNFAGPRLDVLVDGLKRISPELNEAAEHLLRADRPQLADFVGQITNTETYFFRHADHFEALRALVPRRLRPVPPTVFRVWSAGCSTGEEPLSLAATLLDLLPPTVTLSITATDINPTALARANAARYTEWSFRGVTPEQRHRWFQLRDGFFRPREELRRAVSFRRHNLLDGPPEPVPFDLVVCRNVLIYFEPDELAKAVNALSLGVAPRGILVLGPAETAAAQLPDFDAVHQYGCIVHVKRDRFGDWATAAPGPAAQLTSPVAWPAGTPSWTAPPRAEVPPRVEVKVHAPAASAPGALDRARALADQGRFDEARALVETFRAEHGDEGEAHLLLALIALERGDRRMAARELEVAVARDDTLALGHYLLGTIFEEGGAPAESEQAYQRALVALAGATASETVRASGGMLVGDLVTTIDLALQHARKGPR